ncbi:hypothetical protein PC9H_009847 [Pleurotus ostreatus]|uniref:Uncharacterized protein n=1 Tax=Pleurotus ostreatus TaxID=5322 RepID=A0A8H7DPM5_PLEOS|nr:uncharacterized protein PC9H_009847 [Pleurotus ostreatus]KAF7424540.1 hypothetical protein PC9H_009847 [Pleurotus ostreatus]
MSSPELFPLTEHSLLRQRFVEQWVAVASWIFHCPPSTILVHKRNGSPRLNTILLLSPKRQHPLRLRLTKIDMASQQVQGPSGFQPVTKIWAVGLQWQEGDMCSIMRNAKSKVEVYVCLFTHVSNPRNSVDNTVYWRRFHGNGSA